MPRPRAHRLAPIRRFSSIGIWRRPALRALALTAPSCPCQSRGQKEKWTPSRRSWAGGGVRSHGFFPLSEGRAPEDGARRLHGPGGLSQRAPLLRGARGRGRALDDPAHHGGDEAGGAGGGLVEPLPSRARMGCRLEQSGIRPARRDHGPLAHRIRGLQLLRPRHRQHGGARALRHARAAGALARSPSSTAASARPSP